MKNIPRPSRYVLHDDEDDAEKKGFDLGVHLRRYKGNRSLLRLIVLFAVLAYLLYFLRNFPLH